MKKRLLSTLLTLTLVLGLLPAVAPHAHGAEHICADNDFNHHCDEDSCRKYINCYDGDDGRCDLCGGCMTHADEDEDNVCDFCGYCMVHTFVKEYWHSEDGYHYPECDRCFYYDYADGTVCADGDGDGICNVCGTCVGTHDYDWAENRDTESHQLMCSICYSENWEEHFDNNTDAACDICGTCMEHDETKTYVWDKESLNDNDGHYLVCKDCGIGWSWERHSDGDDADSFCDTCGSCEVGAHGDEVWNETDRDEAMHFSKCGICGAAFGWVKHSDEDGNGSCDVCRYCMDGEHSCVWDGENRGNVDHWLVCKDCGMDRGWENHFDDNDDELCDVCEYDMSGSSGGGEDMEPVTYPLWISETQVTSDNADNVLGDSGTVSYAADSGTLILNEATITDPIAALTDLTIHVLGDSTCSNTIWVGGQTGETETTYFDLTISGTASLTFNLPSEDIVDGTVPSIVAKTITIADELGLTTTDPADCGIVGLDADGNIPEDPEDIFVQTIASANGTFPRTVTIAPSAAYSAGKIIVLLADSYGDGWNGAAIRIYANDALVGTATIENGDGNYSGIFEMAYDSTAEYRFVWVEGEYDDECSYKIYVDGEEYTGNLDTESGGGSEGGETPASGSVTITGDPVVGQTLTAETSGFDPGAELTYQWYRVVENRVPIDGATAPTYTLTEADLAWSIYCVVNDVESDHVGSVTLPTYDIRVDDSITGGTITADKTSAAAGEPVTLTITPDAGYQLRDIIINGTADKTVIGKTTVTFAMPAEDIDIFAIFVEGVVVYFDNSVSDWTNVICADGNGYSVCLDLGNDRHGVIVPAGKAVSFTNYMPGMPEAEYPEGYYATVGFIPENGTTYSVETLRNIHVKTEGDQLIVRDLSAEAEEDIDMILMIAGYRSNRQMVDCQVIEDVTGVTEETITVTGDYIKVFFLKPGTYVPLFNDIAL